VFRLDVGGVLDLGPRDCGECGSSFVLALLLHLKGGFLRHGAVEYPVAKDEGAEHRDLAQEWELVSRRGGANHVDDGVAICERANVSRVEPESLTLQPCSRR